MKALARRLAKLEAVRVHGDASSQFRDRIRASATARYRELAAQYGVPDFADWANPTAAEYESVVAPAQAALLYGRH